jgi:hypothetical protein
MGETSYLDNLANRHSLDLSETEEELSMVVRECNSTGMHHAISRKDMEGDAINRWSCELSRPTAETRTAGPINTRHFHFRLREH